MTRPAPYQAKREWPGVTVYHADCLEMLPIQADAVVTDPPYGIDYDYKGHQDDLEGWYSLMNAAVPLCKKSSKFVVMPSCAIKRLGWWYSNHPPDWLIAWYKGSPGHSSAIGFNDWEPHVCWGRPTRPMHDFFLTENGFDNGVDHPCPKTVAYSTWLVSHSTHEGQTILDPFMGSGTTGIACIRTGRKFIGIEKDAKYFQVACDRIERELAQGQLFKPEKIIRPVQTTFA